MDITELKKRNAEWCSDCGLSPCDCENSPEALGKATPLDERSTRVVQFFGRLRNGLAKEKREHLREAAEPDRAIHRRLFDKLDNMIGMMEEFHLARFSSEPNRRKRAFDAAPQLLCLIEEWRGDFQNVDWLDRLAERQVPLIGREYPSFARCVLDLARDHETPLLNALGILKIQNSTHGLGDRPRFWNEQRFVALCGSLDKMEWMSFEDSLMPRVAKPLFIADDVPNESSDAEWLKRLSEFAETLKGTQRRVLELLVSAGGTMRIADIATDKFVDWSMPYKSSADSIKRELKKKLQHLNTCVKQHDNCLKLIQGDTL